MITIRLFALGAALFALNAWIAWRLFFIEYDTEMGSLAGIYIAIARRIATDGLHLDWWPLWFAGMPFQNVYQPAFHATVAAVSQLFGFSPARAYHFVLGWTYSLGPVTFFLLIVRLTRKLGVAAIAGLLYSLTSPAAWLSSGIRLDNGGPFFANRLHAVVTYSDAPHNAGLVLVPLAILALDYALERQTLLAYLLSIGAMCAVPLVNIPASMVLTLAVFAYLLASPRTGSASRLAKVCGIGIAAYCLIGPVLPPSTIRTAVANSWRTDAALAFSAWNVPLLLAASATAVLLRWIGHRFTWPLALRFFVLFTFFTSFITLGNFWSGLTFVAQPGRFQLAMEMAILGAATVGADWLTRRRGVRLVLVIAALVLGVFEVSMYRKFARREIVPVDMTRRSEYKIAQWLDRNFEGGRAFLLGSSAVWLNAFSDVPQVAGCCMQGYLHEGPRWAYYEVGSDDGAGTRAAEISLAWLQALGVSLIAVTGPESTDVFHDYNHPGKFEGALREKWRDGGDVIYEVPQRTLELVHVIEPGELVKHYPASLVDIDALRPYIAAIQDPNHPLLDVRWESPGSAIFTGNLKPEQLISVQMAYHAGWRAEANGSTRPLHADAFGFIVIEPHCTTACTVRLIFDGGTELLVMRVLRWFAIAVIVIYVIFSSFAAFSPRIALLS